jgi:hypothetical protein
MPRIKLIPQVTGDGRIILHAVPDGPGERIKALVDRLRPKPKR